MTQTLTPQQLEVLVKGVDALDAKDRKVLVETFPFENLIGISVLNYELMRAYVQILIKITQFNEFYKNAHAVEGCLEFTLSNLSLLENVCATDLLNGLLGLIRNVISKAKFLKEYIQHIVKYKERILDVITSVVKLKIFEKSQTSVVTEILYDVLTMNGPQPLTASMSLAEVAEIFKGLKAVRELAIISNLVIRNKFNMSSQVFNVCASWLLIYGPSYFLEDNETEETILHLLDVTYEFCNKFGYSKCKAKPLRTELNENFQEFIHNLKTVSDRIVLMAKRETLREASLRLFSYLLSDSQHNSSKQHPQIAFTKDNDAKNLNKLLELPNDPREWPHCQLDVFFDICKFLLMHSNLVWTPKEIVYSISSVIYSKKRFSLESDLLNTLCYLYPVLATEIDSKHAFLLGEELLIIMGKRPKSFQTICTLHVNQLSWILRRGSRSLKTWTLLEWLKTDEADMGALKEALLKCKAQSILLDILMDPNVEEHVKDRVTELTHNLKDATLSKTIAMHIPVALNNKSLLYRLILSNPGIPDSVEDALMLAEYMYRILFLLHDDIVFRSATTYCRCLLFNLQKENRLVPMFCENIENIKFLTVLTKYVSDESAGEILNLLKVLILLQKRNRPHPEAKVEVASSPLFQGSRCKTEQCLDFLHVLLRTKNNRFIRLEGGDVKTTFLNLLSLARSRVYSRKSYGCLCDLLEENAWLAGLDSVGLFVEVQCALQVDTETGLEFVTFLATWLKVLKRNPHVVAGYVPNKGTVSNYLKRVTLISQKTLLYLLKILNKLKMYSNSNSLTSNDGLYELNIR